MKKERGAKKTKFIRNLKVCFETFSFFSGTGAEDENDKKLFFSSKTKFIIFFLSFKDENSFLVFFRKLGFSKNFRIGQVLSDTTFVSREGGWLRGCLVGASHPATLGTGFESRRSKLASHPAAPGSNPGIPKVFFRENSQCELSPG